VIRNLESYFTPQEKFQEVSRGKPLPHSLSDERKQAAGLTRETWKLEVIFDPDHPAKLCRRFTELGGPPNRARRGPPRDASCRGHSFRGWLRRLVSRGKAVSIRSAE
jgi:hypothetical protein